MNSQQSKNTMSEHGCDICGGLGYTVRRTESGKLVSRTCKCEIIRRNRLRMERSGLLGLLDSCTFESFQTQEYWQRAAKQAAEKYLTDWKGKWFFIGGSPGTGKTHLCTAICAKLMDGGIPVRYVQWRGDIPAIKAKTNDAEAYAEAMQPLKTVRALYIDDFLKGSVTDADKNIAFDLRPGAITGFIGRNGAGKTTTLKSLLNFVHPDAGEIRFFGKTFGGNETEIKSRIGFVSGGVHYYTMKKLKAIPGLVCEQPEGAFYFMVKLPVDNTDKFQQWLLEEFNTDGDTVMVTPGEGFYATPGKGVNEARLAYVLKQADLERASLYFFAVFTLFQAVCAQPSGARAYGDIGLLSGAHPL